MNFRQVFDSYSSQTKQSDRTEILSQNNFLPGNTSFQIREYIESINSAETDIPADGAEETAIDENNDIAPDTEGSSEAPESEENNILDTLSELDNFSEESEEEVEEEIDTTDPLSDDFDFSNLDEDIKANDDGFDINDIPLTDEASDEDEFSFEDTTNDDEVSDADEFSFEDTANDDEASDVDEFSSEDTANDDEASDVDEFSSEDTANDDEASDADEFSSEDTDTTDFETSDPDGDLDLDDLFNELSEDGVDNTSDDDIDFETFDTEEEFGDDSTDFNFNIENPEELELEAQEITNKLGKEEESFEESFDVDSMELPDFSDTKVDELKASPTVDVDSLEPTPYQNAENQENFDHWSNHKSDFNFQDFTSLNLTDQQIFEIREHLNTIQNKETRMQLRSIILDPEFHKAYLDQLISLLLIKAPEDKLTEFLDENLKELPHVSIASSEFKAKRSIFFADDVARFEQFKERFTKQLQFSAIFGLIAILLGSIMWFGFAQPSRVISLFKKGIIAIKNDKFTEGEALFTQAQQIAGKPLPEWYIKYGDEYAIKEMNTLAETKYLSAIAIDPEDVDTTMHIINFYTNLGIEYFPKAMDIIHRLSRTHPKKFEVWDTYGSLYVALGNMEKNLEARKEAYFEAANIYTDYIRNNPKNIAPYYQMIDIYIKLGDSGQINLITSIINSENPEFLNIEILNALTKYHIDRRELDEASRLFKQSIPFLDKYITRLPKLSKELHKRYNIHPDSLSNLLSDSYFEFARYKMLSSDLSGAATILTNSIYFNNSNANSYNLLGEVFLASANNFNDAERLFNQALEIDSDFYKPHINLGHVNYYYGGQLQDLNQAENTAIYHYRLAKSLMPLQIENYLLDYNLGWLELKNGNKLAALDLWSNIYKQNPNDPFLNYAMASALYENQNPHLSATMLEKSIKVLTDIKNKIIDINPNTPRHKKIFTQLAKAHNNLGVINVNYADANINRRDYFESQALLHFYESKNVADQISMIYNVTEYNIGVLTRPNIERQTIYDTDIPKHTNLENDTIEFQKNILKRI